MKPTRRSRMQIAAYPPSEQWLTIPEFPPPGWERERARRQSLRLGLHTPDRRAELERLLREVQRMDRPSALARLLYLGDDAQSLFAVDIVLVIAHDDGTKAARHWAQQQLLRGILGPVQDPPLRSRRSADSCEKSRFGLKTRLPVSISPHPRAR